MRDTIRLFMWGYQHCFCSNVERLVRSLFEEVAPEIVPTVYLIGVRIPESKEPHPVCVEPEDEPLDVERFSGLHEAIEERIKTHPLNNVYFGDDARMRDKPKNIRRASIHEAVKERLGAYDSERATTSFVGRPVRYGDYDVLCVIQIDTAEFDSRPHLTTTVIDKRWAVVRSFQEAIIGEVLSVAASGLKSDEPGRFPLDSPSNEEIRRQAAEGLLTRVAWSGGRIEDLRALYRACMDISARLYEGEESRGRVIVCKKGHPQIDVVAAFRHHVPINRSSWARKAVELASGDIGVLCDGYEFFGLGRVRPGYDCADESVFEIHFGGYLKWDLMHAEDILLRIKDGVPSLPKERLSRTWFNQNLRRVFRGMTREQADAVWQIVSVAMVQGHGTMIVVASDAAEEASRLAAQAWPVEPMPLTPGTVAQVTAIDGAVLIDTSGGCHAFGVILDGLATALGTPAKGARYNSAVRYVASRPRAPTVAIVISEDGDVSVFPALKDQISRAVVADYVARAQEAMKIDEEKDSWQVLRWLDEHRFYLDAAACTIANQFAVHVETIRKKAGSIWIVRDVFVPDPEMDDSHFEECFPL